MQESSTLVYATWMYISLVRLHLLLLVAQLDVDGCLRLRAVLTLFHIYLGNFHTGVRSHLGKQAPTLLISRERIEN